MARVTSSERKFRPDIEGLRALAVGLVVLSHAGVGAVEGGYIGVDVFFVVSGFLITGLLVRERATTGTLSMAGFYARRARRILPAASVVLVLTVLASYEWLGYVRGNVIAEDGRWAAVFAANLRFASEGTQYLNLTAPPSPLQHYWSLAVEEQFYLVWPLLFLAVATFAPRLSLAAKLAAVLVLVVAASFAWSILQTQSSPAWAFFSPLTRAWELAIGSLLAVGEPRLRRLSRRIGPWLSWTGLGAVGGAAFAFDNGTAFPGYAAALPVVGTALVVAGGSIAPGASAERLLSLSPFQALGKWSYSFYLWHWPVLIIAAQRAGHSLPLSQNLALVVAALGLAVVTHYIIENPIRFARPLTRSSWTSLSVGACLVAAAYGLSGWQIRTNTTSSTSAQVADAPATASPRDLNAGAPPPEADVRVLVEASARISTLPAGLVPRLESANKDFGWLLPAPDECLVDPEVIESPPCVFGDPEGSRSVVVVGDSHAAQWLPAFDAIGKELGWRVELLTKAGCPAAWLSFRIAYQSSTERLIGPPPGCLPWLENTLARISASHPDAVILSSCNGCEYMVDDEGKLLTREAWAAGLRETLDRLHASATTAIILGDIPRLKLSIDCLALHPGDVQKCAQPRELAAGATYNDIERQVAETAGAPFVDVTPWFCGTVCSPVIGDMLVYTNDYHVTGTYAAFLTGELRAALQPIVEAD